MQRPRSHAVLLIEVAAGAVGDAFVNVVLGLVEERRSDPSAALTTAALL